jgi:hypothetical protein
MRHVKTETLRTADEPGKYMEDEAIVLRHGDHVLIDGINWMRQTFRTLHGSRVSEPWGETFPYAADLKQNNGKAVWFSAEPSVLSLEPQPEVERITIRLGQLFIAEGRLYKVEKPGVMSGDNAQAVEQTTGPKGWMWGPARLWEAM